MLPSSPLSHCPTHILTSFLSCVAVVFCRPPQVAYCLCSVSRSLGSTLSGLLSQPLQVLRSSFDVTHGVVQPSGGYAGGGGGNELCGAAAAAAAGVSLIGASGHQAAAGGAVVGGGGGVGFESPIQQHSGAVVVGASGAAGVQALQLHQPQQQQQQQQQPMARKVLFDMFAAWCEEGVATPGEYQARLSAGVAAALGRLRDYEPEARDALRAELLQAAELLDQAARLAMSALLQVRWRG
jgi:hypothetical protein